MYQINEAFLAPDVDKYVLLVTLAPSFASFALAFYVRPYPPAEQDKDIEDIKQRFRLAYVSFQDGCVWLSSV